MLLRMIEDRSITDPIIILNVLLIIIDIIDGLISIVRVSLALMIQLWDSIFKMTLAVDRIKWHFERV